ncbi:MAG: hypothetical protein J3K34DRAFT_440869 [Monoraphidium minutum]|nr:MAG: hypothetical protein J3K34DRAFT_440869 [Monoraphidium minutum]
MIPASLRSRGALPGYRSRTQLASEPGCSLRRRAPAAPADGARRPHPARPRRATCVGAIDYAALWEAHIATEFTEKSADAAVATMVETATVNHVPTLMGGEGREDLRRFYATHFIPKMPDDVVIKPLNRTIAPESQRVVDEFLFEFTHSVAMDWMLPGLAPTGRRVSVPFIVVVDFEGDKLKAERIYWDQATVLKQLGLLPEGLPVAGAEQSRKAESAGEVPSNQMLGAMSSR